MDRVVPVTMNSTLIYSKCILVLIPFSHAVDFGSGLFGSGGNLLEVCECRREVECSIAAAYNTEGTGV